MTLKSTRVVAITGGKGGVGKSNVALNLGVCLANKGKRVMLLDADLGLANLDILLGIRSERTMEHVLDGTCDLRDILVTGPGGIQIIPASSGTQRLADLSEMEQAGIIHAFDDLEGQFDYLFVDTAAGISKTVLNFINASQDVVLVVCNEPTSITDTYAVIKVMNQQFGSSRFHVVVNMVRSMKEAKQVFSKLERTANQFMDVALHYMGFVPYDEQLRQSVREQKSVCVRSPSSAVAKSFESLARTMLNWPNAAPSEGRLEFFVNQLVSNHC